MVFFVGRSSCYFPKIIREQREILGRILTYSFPSKVLHITHLKKYLLVFKLFSVLKTSSWNTIMYHLYKEIYIILWRHAWLNPFIFNMSFIINSFHLIMNYSAGLHIFRFLVINIFGNFYLFYWKIHKQS